MLLRLAVKGYSDYSVKNVNIVLIVIITREFYQKKTLSNVKYMYVCKTYNNCVAENHCVHIL